MITSERVNGWQIDEDSARPITGRWRAICHGVDLYANDRPALLAVIERHAADKQAWRNRCKANYDWLEARAALLESL